MRPKAHIDIVVWECPICGKKKVKKDDIVDCIDGHKIAMFKEKFQKLMEKFLKENFNFEFDKSNSSFNSVYAPDYVGKKEIKFSYSLHGVIKFTESGNNIILEVKERKIKNKGK